MIFNIYFHYFKQLCPSLLISTIEKALREIIEFKKIERRSINRATYYLTFDKIEKK